MFAGYQFKNAFVDFQPGVSCYLSGFIHLFRKIIRGKIAGRIQTSEPVHISIEQRIFARNNGIKIGDTLLWNVQEQ
jgi:hypothetical protein